MQRGAYVLSACFEGEIAQKLRSHEGRTARQRRRAGELRDAHPIWGARTFFHLNYLRADMTCERDASSDALRYRCVRVDDPPGGFVGRYGPAGDDVIARPSALERFLTERYCLYTVDDDGRPMRGHIQHAPWPLQRGFCEMVENTIVPVPLELRGAPLVHFARRIDVVGWPLERA